MKISIISFTKQGNELADRLKDVFPEYEIKTYHKTEQKLQAWTAEQFAKKRAVIFIGACGIAVRAISPCVKDKMTDPPVLVLDERGRFVVPILSGHIGGANELATLISDRIGSTAVITTATDIQNKFAVDLFAKKNALHILNRDGIAKVSAKILREEPLIFQIEDYEKRAGKAAGVIPKGVVIFSDAGVQKPDVLIGTDADAVKWHNRAVLRLKPKEYVLGIGCTKGKPEEEIAKFIYAKLKDLEISEVDIAMIASIENKKNEIGICRFAESIGVPFITYTKEQLKKTEGNFSGSDFVEKTVGVDNVCERAALTACMGEGVLVLNKQINEGMTLAVARRNWKIKWEW